MNLLKKTHYLTETQAKALYVLSIKNRVSQSEIVRVAIQRHLKEIFLKDNIETKKVSIFQKGWRKFISNRH